MGEPVLRSTIGRDSRPGYYDLLAKPASPAFIALLTFAMFALAVAFFWPGSLSFDPTKQWYEARTGIVTSQHPPFMAFIWHYLDRIVPGPGLMLVLELAIGFSAVAVFLAALSMSRLTVLAIATLGAVQPFLIAHAAIIIKDVLGGNLVLLAFAILLHYPKAKRPAWLLCGSAALLVLATFVRYQFLLLIPIAAIGVFLVGSAPLKVIAGRLTIAGVAGVLVAIAAQTGMSATLELRPRFFDIEVRQLLDYDIASATARDRNADLSILSNAGVDVNALHRQALAEYSTYGREPLSDRGGVEDLTSKVSEDVLRRQWSALLVQEPSAFLLHRVVAFSHLMGIGNIYACWPLTTVGFLGQPVPEWQALHGETLRPSFATHLLRARWFPAGTILFRPITYLLLSILAFAMLAKTWRGPTVLVLSLIVGSWIYWLSFLPVPLACGVRYSYFPCAADLMALFYLIALELNRRWPVLRHYYGLRPTPKLGY